MMVAASHKPRLGALGKKVLLAINLILVKADEIFFQLFIHLKYTELNVSGGT